jgi:hypothetical protein
MDNRMYFFFGKLCSSSKSMRSEGLMRCELWVWTSEDSPMLSLHWIFPSKQVWCSWNYKSWSLMTTWNIPSYSTCATCYVTGHLTFLIVEKILKRYKYFFKTNIIRRSLTQNCRIIKLSYNCSMWSSIGRLRSSYIHASLPVSTLKLTCKLSFGCQRVKVFMLSCVLS